MLETDYSFLKNNYLFISLFILLFTGFSCTPDTLWDIPIQTITESLEKSDYTFLKNLDFKDKKPTDVRILGHGASFYFSFIFSHIGYPEYAKNLLTYSWENETKLWKEEAGILFLSDLLKEKEYKLLEENGLNYLKKMKTSINLPQVKKLYIEALYWQEKDEAVLYTISQFFPDEQEINQIDPELLLFKAVSECRLQKNGWQKTLAQFLLGSESSLLHNRVYQFIILEPERLASLDTDMQQFLLAKSFLGTGYLKNALPLVEYFIENIDPVILQDSTIINELGRAYLSLGEHTRGLKFLTTLSKKQPEKENLDALEMAGRIARKDDKYREAARYLEPVFHHTKDLFQKDRAAWFYLDCILEISSIRFIDEIVSYATQWQDPSYFDDIIQKGISILIAEKKWKQLESFFHAMKAVVSREIVIQMNYLTARFITLGYIESEKSADQTIIETYLKDASKEMDNNYYGFLAASLLNKKPQFLSIDNAFIDNDNKSKINPLSAIDELILGFIDFGLIEEGYAMITKYSEFISGKTLFSVAKILQQRGDYKKSIWLMNRLIHSTEYQPREKILTYSYPRVYKSFIEENAKTRDFYAPIFYALVREESAFDAHNTSSAGAIGLTQLMPTTAQDIAGWLRLEDYNLGDPQTNILMGAYYYSRLLRLLKNIPYTLVAYNAGLGRLRRWEKEYNGLPPDLFIEALPYRETRNYVKKIIVTACIYSYLYDNKTPANVLTLFFPHLFSQN